MAGFGNLLSTVAMGLLLIGVVAFVRARGWRPTTGSWRPEPAESGGSGTDALSHYSEAAIETARSPKVWYVTFVLLVLGFPGGAVLLVASPPEIGGAVFLGLSLAFGAVLCAFLVWGIYRSGRHRGLKSAQAAMAGAWALGSLLVVAIVVKLIVSAP
jgi:hypothetical protein